MNDNMEIIIVAGSSQRCWSRESITVSFLRFVWRNCIRLCIQYLIGCFSCLVNKSMQRVKPYTFDRTIVHCTKCYQYIVLRYLAVTNSAVLCLIVSIYINCHLLYGPTRNNRIWCSSWALHVPWRIIWCFRKINLGEGIGLCTAIMVCLVPF